MIRYSLSCDRGDRFEAWFRDAADFESQAARTLLSCPVCGSETVAKTLMAPAVSTGRRKTARHATAPDDAVQPPAPDPTPASAAPAAASPAPDPVTLAAPDPRQEALVEMIRAVNRHVRATAEDVGDRFADEARRIHYQEAPPRGIYGQTTPDEARSLVEEGIPVHPLPKLPEDHN